MAFPLILAAPAAIQAGLGLYEKLFGSKKPQEPELPTYQGITGEERNKQSEALARRINKQVAKASERTEQTLASRGLYRSGQLPQEITEINKAGIDALAEGEVQLTEAEIQDRKQFQLLLEQIKQNKYAASLADYNNSQSSAGQNLGGGIGNLTNLLALYNLKG